MGTITTSDGTRSSTRLVLRGARGVEPRLAAERRRLGRPGQGGSRGRDDDITDPLTVQVANLPGITRDIQSA
jgi:hypothetical protein